MDIDSTKVFKTDSADKVENVLIDNLLSVQDSENHDLKTIAPYRASIVYDKDKQTFVGVDGASGEAPVYDTASKDLLKAVKNLESDVKLTSEKKDVDGEKASESEKIKDSLKEANSYLELKITCSFKPENKDEKTEVIDKGEIANWIVVDKDGSSVSLDGETMATYCSELAGKHNVSKSRKAKFKTTSQGDIDVNVASDGQTVDANKLYTDIYNAIENKKSKTIDAVYSKADETQTGEYVDFGGNYCEVDLTNQMVYVYKDGKQVVSSQCVTGCIAKGYGTPAGVYSIFSMDKDRYLRGDGYKTWVNFFIPFNGGIGFHDASWRSTFGGKIYLYSGSHGCINMPYSAVKELYANVSMGEKVILYGGETHVEGKEQEWSGETAFTVEQGSNPFNLGVSCLDNAKLVYSSDNDGVATVDENGNVTPGSAGTATITVNSEATGVYKASSMTIIVNVNAPQQAQEQQPTQQQPTQQQTVPEQVQAKNATVKIGCGDKTVTEGDVAFNLNASVDSGAALTYESSNPSVATVDSNGNVTILKAGTAVITVKSSAVTGWNEGSSKINIIVNPNPQETTDIENATNN